MKTEIKDTVTPAETLEKLDIRMGEIVNVEIADNCRRPSYNLNIDFGKHGRKNSIGRFTCHTPEELLGMRVPCVLNFPPREIDGYTSEVLVLGIQFPKADSLEATPLHPKEYGSKLGSKVF